MVIDLCYARRNLAAFPPPWIGGRTRPSIDVSVRVQGDEYELLANGWKQISNSSTTLEKTPKSIVQNETSKIQKQQQQPHTHHSWI